jgi:hypothetical protein
MDDVLWGGFGRAIAVVPPFILRRIAHDIHPIGCFVFQTKAGCREPDQCSKFHSEDVIMRFSGKVCRLFVSGTTILSFGLALASASVITGCADSDKSAGQVENAVNPAEKAQDSMKFYKGSDVQKKIKQGAKR